MTKTFVMQTDRSKDVTESGDKTLQGEVQLKDDVLIELEVQVLKRNVKLGLCVCFAINQISLNRGRTV